MAGQINADQIPAGSVLRLGVMQTGTSARIIRISVYQNGSHLVTVAESDRGTFVVGSEPLEMDAVATALDENPVAVSGNRDLPDVYDGIYRAGLAYGMTTDMIGQIIRMLASNVDFEAKLHPADMLEAFFSVADEKGDAGDDSELLFVNAKFGNYNARLYRFQHPKDNTIDYYDENGRSARQFLLRNPVPNGKFRSGFGMRRHPILGYSRMHTGTDWAAPRGTPIIAAGNGTVVKAGWDSGGYGNQTLIRHANGYVSSYNHQSAISKSVKKGARCARARSLAGSAPPACRPDHICTTS